MHCNKTLTGNKKLYCSNNCKQKAHYKKIKDQPNTYHNQTLRYFKRKIEVIELLSGKCAYCGYSKNIAALDFHHINSETKLFNLDSRMLANGNKEKLLIEVRKCILLCATCHRELHYPEMNLNDIGPVPPLPHKQ